MLTLFKIAIGNLLKNKRRSFFTIGAVSFGFAAINLLGGFTEYVFKGLEESYVYTYANGHLSIFKQGFFSGSIISSSNIIDHIELNQIINICQKDKRILLVTPQLDATGLISNGDISTIMFATGKRPGDIKRMRQEGTGFIAHLKTFHGKELKNGDLQHIGIAKGLAKRMHLNIGDKVVILASTIDGFMNALDAEIAQLIDAPMDLLNDMWINASLKFNRTLYDTKGADRINILLKRGVSIEQVKDSLERNFKKMGVGCEIHTWQELRPSYLRIHNMFIVIFSFAFIIVLVIVAMSIINTISMSVLERTREIGTLRALGMKRFKIVIMFAIEAASLAIIGSIVGLVLTTGTCLAVGYFRPTWIPPNIPKEVPLEIYIVPTYIILSFICMFLLSIFATIFPARKAAKLSIVEALRHV